VIAGGAITIIRCKHKEEAASTLIILHDWWKHNKYPEEENPNTLA
jgi:hypothetical protein